ncbi:Mitochondrial import inner membrane translocase subunit Tim9 [Babesia microti strain RI]|uniref:Mitochondrial import inner membrane translocase subunit n=1 Tax=Babesia microti (strain RI) TaxID=1133968 RepID=A0A0K3APF6_BABMR|nr:Mitochondrial import inner membrane translocase subunit Tim9 [Babesia microti strain RI]CTQ41367.1 Mitochondrial import inner membrane translocase subunit Tim9 [Babesia microti strain RI]|eukprot:XP_012649378.1 Mitochondrial import inner membrane translocase subunit Tim9 [Babesia microti strain RI]
MDAAISNLSAKEREAVMAEFDKVQYQDTMETYNGITQRCFNECVTSFKSKDLDKRETECVGNCVKKFIAYSQRVSMRFGEKAS